MCWTKHHFNNSFFLRWLLQYGTIMLLRHRFYSIKVYVFSFVAPFIVNVIDWNWFLYIYNAHYTHHLCGGFFCVKISCFFFRKKNIVFNWERKRMVNLFQKPTIVQFNQIINIIVYERVCFFFLLFLISIIFNADLSHLPQYIQSNRYNSDFGVI